MHYCDSPMPILTSSTHRHICSALNSSAEMSSDGNVKQWCTDCQRGRTLPESRAKENAHALSQAAITLPFPQLALSGLPIFQEQAIIYFYYGLLSFSASVFRRLLVNWPELYTDPKFVQSLYVLRMIRKHNNNDKEHNETTTAGSYVIIAYVFTFMSGHVTRFTEVRVSRTRA